MSAKLLDKRGGVSIGQLEGARISWKKRKGVVGEVRKFHVSVYEIHGSLRVNDENEDERKEEQQRKLGEDLFRRYGVCRCRRPV